MDEIQELLEEGKVLERRLKQIKKRLLILSKLNRVSINLEDWKME